MFARRWVKKKKVVLQRVMDIWDLVEMLIFANKIISPEPKWKAQQFQLTKQNKSQSGRPWSLVAPDQPVSSP